MPTPDLYRELSKWQAVSHPELARRKPEELFDTEFGKRYTRLHDLLWRRFVRLHDTLRTLEELEQFPFRDIYAPDDMSFWVLVTENFRDTFCIILHSLTKDRGSDAHTILRFKNEIITANWREQRLLDLFKKTLAECGFDDRIESIAKRMADIRDHRVAHQLVDRAIGKLRGVMEGVSLEEQRELFDAAHALFGALSFGSAYVTLTADLMPSTVGGQPKRSCLTSVLDAVLKDSYIVNHPELRNKWWPTDRQHMNPATLEQMNRLRARVGKPPA